MRKTLGYVSALALMAGLAASASGPHGAAGRSFSPIAGAQAASVEHQSAINGTINNTAVVAPTFFTTSGNTPQSFIRFFNGAGLAGSTTTSTFSVTLVGDKSGNVYGSSFNIVVPHMGSLQYSMNDLATLAGSTLGSLTGADTGYVVYIQNPDKEAGFMHAVYDPVSQLFENMSMCNTNINEQMTSLHNEVVLTNVHTSVGPSKIGQNFPSTVRIHNYYNVPITYTITIFNSGGNLTSSLTAPANAGAQICQLTGNTVAANTTLTISVSTIEANPACSGVNSADYLNFVFSDQSGGSPNAMASHTVFVSKYDGNTSMTPTCAVNVLSTGSTTIPVSPYT